MESYDLKIELQKSCDKERERLLEETNVNKSALASLVQKFETSKARTYNGSQLSSLESNIKKSTAFVRRLKTISADSLPQLIQESKRLNLSRFVSEVASCIGTSKLNHRSRPEFTLTSELSFVLSSYYQSFSSSLFSHFLTTLFSTSSPNLSSLPPPRFPVPDAISQSRSDPAQRRATIRLMFELQVNGVLKQGPFLVALLERLYLEDKSEVDALLNHEKPATGRPGAPSSTKQIVYGGSDNCLYNLPVFICILRSFGDLGEFVLFNHCFEPEIQSNVKEILFNYSNMVFNFFKHTNKLLHRVFAENEAFTAQKGTLSDKESQRDSVLKARWSRLLSGVSLISQIFTLNFEELNPIEESYSDDEDQKSKILIKTNFSSEQSDDWEAFDSSETKSFYTSLLPLSDLLPDLSTRKDDDNEAQSDSKDDQIDGSDDVVIASHDPLSALVKQLPDTYSVDRCDKLTLDMALIVYRSKSKRRRLAFELSNSPPSKLSVCPYFARCIATLGTVFPDIPGLVLERIIGSFIKTFKTCSQTIKSGAFLSRDASLLAELAKFSVAPPSIVFKCLAKCLSKFQHHLITAACLILEGCGRFLFHNEHVRPYLESVLDRLKKVTNQKVLDDRMKALVDNAYFSCVPPEKAGVSRVKTDVQKWIEHVILNCHRNIQRAADSLRRVEFSSENFEFIVESFIKLPHQMPPHKVLAVAKLLCCLADRRPDIFNRVVDDLIDTLKIGLMIGDASNRHLRLSCAHLLGCLGQLSAIPIPSLTSLCSELLFHCSGPDTCEGMSFDPIRGLLVCSLVKPLCFPVYKSVKRPRQSWRVYVAELLKHPVTQCLVYVQFFILRTTEVLGSASNELLIALDDVLLSLQGVPRLSTVDEALELINQMSTGQNTTESDEQFTFKISEAESIIVENRLFEQFDFDCHVERAHDDVNTDTEWSIDSDEEAVYSEEEQVEQEEDDFDLAFKAIVDESVSFNFNSVTSNRNTGLDMSVPLVRDETSKKLPSSLNFTVVRLLKNSHKKAGKSEPKLKPLVVPSSTWSHLASPSIVDSEERGEVKKAVLMQVETQVKEDSMIQPERKKTNWVNISL
ncbi:hypothetical protein RCL1_005830 [Eukaryota sp. TZLM3-RCL]